MRRPSRACPQEDRGNGPLRLTAGGTLICMECSILEARAIPLSVGIAEMIPVMLGEATLTLAHTVLWGRLRWTVFPF